MGAVIETQEREGVLCRVSYDDCPPNPLRDYDVPCMVLGWHRRYDIGTGETGREPPPGDRPWFKTPEDYYEWRRENGKELVHEFPLYMYDHGGVVLSLSPFSCPWDSGQIGFVAMTKDHVKEFFGDSMPWRLKDRREKVVKFVEETLAEYTAYLNGEVYQYAIQADGEIVAGCGGYIGEVGMKALKKDAAAEMNDIVRRRREEESEKTFLTV